MTPLVDFYIEDPRVTARSDAEIQVFRRQKGIQVFGDDVPHPVTSFDEAGLPDYVRSLPFPGRRS